VPDPDLKPTNPHPPGWQGDLNPDFMAGQNFTVRNADAGKDWPTAFDIKDLHRALSEFLHDDDLKQIPVVPTGSRLVQGKTYVDLAAWPGTEFKAMANMGAESGHWYVPKDEVDYRIWNRLIGVQDPSRFERSA
jgi:hypothetical protein